MEFKLTYITEDIKLSCYEDRLFKTEVVFDHHMLVWFISGETKIIQADQDFLFKSGDIFLIPRNQLATIINYPKDGKPHQSVVMHLSIDTLRKFYSGKNIKINKPLHQKILSFEKHPLLESCLSSLIPYFNLQENFPEDIAALKIREAITILRNIYPGIDNLLANFEEPHKIDLSAFMEKNFMFNMPIEKFGYLTGRSLTSFKRDFQKLYNTTPQRWLTQKRLELAYYHLAEKRRKPTEVYLETGFENLSHFSFAFKKRYGINPTDIAYPSASPRN